MIPFPQLKATFFCTLLALGLVFPPQVAFSQLTIEWDKTYGGTGWEEMAAALSTNDGGYIYGGITTTRQPSSEITQPTKDTVVWPELEGDFWIVKTDGNGNPVWDKIIGGFAVDRLWSILPTPDGGYLLGGESHSGIGADRSYPCRGELDFWVVKIDANGNKQWDRAYGGTGTDILRKILPMSDGGFWLAGYSNSPASFEKSTASINGTFDFWSVKIGADGTPLGDYTIGGSGQDWLFDAETSHDGNVLLAGWSDSPPGFGKSAPNFGYNDYWVVKSNLSGNKIWDETFGGNERDACLDLYPTNDGKYIASGHSWSARNTGNKTSDHYGLEDAWFVKFADLGDNTAIEWQSSFGGQSADYGYAVAENGAGFYMLLGSSSSAADSVAANPGNKGAQLIGGSDYWAIFLNPQGQKFWDETLGGIFSEVGVQIFPAHDYGFILAGHSASEVSPPYKSEPSRGLNDIWVVRTGCAFPGPELEDLAKVCRDDQVLVDATISVPCPLCLYFWDDGGTGALRNFAPDTTVQVKVTVVHPDGCDRSDSLTIEIVPGPDAFAADLQPIRCFGETDAQFLVESVEGGTPPYQFSLDGAEWEAFANYVNLSPGDYDLSILDSNGCTLDTSFFIEQPQQVLVELGPDIFLELGDSVQLQALTNLPDSFTFEWGQPALLSCADCLEPWVLPFYTTTVSIVLKDKNGCQAEDFLRVVVQQSDAVYLPNVFSPNGDNINDFFTLYADRSVRQVKSLLIFDRWGEKMFETYDFPPNVEQLGWDGHLNGHPMKPAVFVWSAEVEYVDGRTGFFEGDLTLMR
ncbi:MAG: gliding motility-associated C-terminal domain-containing protein [Bacteroidetes bacterium]|nr:gliding motility-associated C-terminal domain-containing protein [Bacteroidota bacterium]